MHPQHFVARGCRDLVEPSSHDIECRARMQQVSLDAVRQGYCHVKVQGDRFGDDFSSRVLQAMVCQELLGSECALHGEALSVIGVQSSTGGGKPKVVQCRSDKQ